VDGGSTHPAIARQGRRRKRGHIIFDRLVAARTTAQQGGVSQITPLLGADLNVSAAHSLFVSRGPIAPCERVSSPVAAPPPPLAPLARGSDPDAVLGRFLAVAAERGLELYPEQEEAILELFAGRNVILNTPTGSGKSLVAAAFHFKALCAGERSVYTCPIKALVNEKFLSLCRDFGPENVGMMTGDASVNPHAPVLCCTAEILANVALARGDHADIRAVIMDEFHYYSDAERGYAWQVPLLTMPRARFLLMSATLGATEFFEKELERLTGAPGVTVRSDRRPVPLEFEYSETPLTEKIQTLLDDKRAPVYLVYFTQRAASEAAQSLMSLNVCSREEKATLASELEGVRFNSPYGKEMKRWLRHGIGVHHAGLLPKYRILVEQLAQRGLLKLICGTDTLGVGINVPIRTVVFTQLWKYDGKKAAILSVRDFRQVAGRAGRKGYDDKGYVVIQAPEHVVENKRAEEKAAGDPKKQKKLVKQRAPEGAVGWDAKTFEKLMTAPSEGLVSRFDVSHGMLLLVLSRDADGCRAMRQLIADSHETPHRKRQLCHRAFQLFRALLDRKIIEWIPPQPSGRKLRVNLELQDDFSLHQALSLYLIDTLPLLDRASPDYPFDVLTLCEAIVEDPDAILRRQVDRLKGEKLEELRAAGVPYEERMEKLEEIEHPKPLREFLYDTFNQFAAAHPWIDKENVRPKSIAREMYERYLSFADYVRAYGLERSEGLLLRHLSQTWKVLAQTVPETFKTEEVVEMEIYFRELIRGIDSSLLEEWERLRNPEFVAAETADKPQRPATFDITRDRATFQRLVRNTVFGFLQDVAARDWESAASRLEPQQAVLPADGASTSPEARRLETAFAPYFEARGRFRLDPEGRSAKHTHWTMEPQDPTWSVSQVLVDQADQNDWEATFSVKIDRSRAENRAVVQFAGLAPIGQPPPETAVL
jgi:superfamily II DNA or RNA helicase